MNAEYDHPFPQSLVEDMARGQLGLRSNELHKVLEGLHNEFGWLNSQIRRNIQFNHSGYRKVKENSEEVYYLVPQSEWREIIEALHQPTYIEFDVPRDAGPATRKVHDRYVNSRVNVSLGDRYGLVLPNE
jgi:hypothetical protein